MLRISSSVKLSEFSPFVKLSHPEQRYQRRMMDNRKNVQIHSTSDETFVLGIFPGRGIGNIETSCCQQGSSYKL